MIGGAAVIALTVADAYGAVMFRLYKTPKPR